jgi:exopolysaccharide biosynthesis protein
MDLKKYYLGRPDDAFKIMRELGLGISQADLACIHKPGLSEAIDDYSRYESKKISTDRGEFSAETVTISLDNPKLRIITDTADDNDCDSNCQAKTLADFVFSHRGFAGINATYFCSDSSCQAINYYFFPVYNSVSGKMINEDQLKYWTTGPIMAFDSSNNFYYFKDSRDFGSVASFESKYGVKLQAAIGNKPRLIENGLNALIDWEVDAKQRNGKYLRNAIAYRPATGKGEILLVVLRSATLDDLASVLKSMGVKYALNLDGGASAALIYNGEYMVGPGRNIPNAIIFTDSN